MKHESYKWEAFIWAIVLATIFMALTIVPNPIFDADDDFAISYVLSREGNTFSPFQWRLLSVIVHGLFVALPSVNWWGICLMIANWFSVAGCVYVLFRRYPRLYAVILSGSILSVLWLCIAHRFSFTRSAMTVAMAGSMLIADHVFSNNKFREAPAEYIIGCFLLLFGASIRFESAMLALALLAVCGLLKLLDDDFIFRRSWFIQHKRAIILLWIAAFLFIGCMIFDRILLTPEQKAYLEYNSLRASIQDYPGNYPPYAENAGIYFDMGLSENAVKMLFGWCIEDTAVFTPELLQQVSALSEPKLSIGTLFDRINDNLFLLIIAFLIIIFISFRETKNWKNNQLIMWAGIFMAVFITLRGRMPNRVFAPLVWITLAAVAFISGDDTPIDRNEDDFLMCKSGRKWNIPDWCTRGFSLLLIMGFCFSTGITVRYAVNLRRIDTQPETVQNLENFMAKNRKMADIMNEDNEHLYIFDIYADPVNFSMTCPFWEPMGPNYCDNRFILGGWSTHGPQQEKLRQENGIYNSMKALYDHSNVYSYYSPRVHKHLNEYYSPSITASQVALLDTVPMVQYTNFIRDGLIQYDDTHSSKVTAFVYTDDLPQVDAFNFAAELTGAEDLDGEFYCNINIDGERKTYRLGTKDGLVGARLYGIPNGFTLDQADIAIFEKVGEDSYLGYKVVDVDLPVG